MSFERHYHCGNPSLFSGNTAVPSRPKFHTFTVNLAVFAPQLRWRQKPWKSLLAYEAKYIKTVSILFQGNKKYCLILSRRVHSSSWLKSGDVPQDGAG